MENNTGMLSEYARIDAIIHNQAQILKHVVMIYLIGMVLYSKFKN